MAPLHLHQVWKVDQYVCVADDVLMEILPHRPTDEYLQHRCPTCGVVVQALRQRGALKILTAAETPVGAA